jgi:ribosomal protein S27AE
MTFFIGHPTQKETNPQKCDSCRKGGVWLVKHRGQWLCGQCLSERLKAIREAKA